MEPVSHVGSESPTPEPARRRSEMKEAIVDLWNDAAAAFRLFTVTSSREDQPDRDRLARAALFFPVVGALIGGALVACSALAERLVSRPVSSVLVVAVWAGLSGGMTLRCVAAVARGRTPGETRTSWAKLAVALVVASKTVTLALTATPLAARALIIAPLLGRWALVVLAHGARPVRGGTAAAFQLGRVTFREFAWSSVMAFAITLSLADAVGLVFIIVAAAIATGIRLLAYARSGAMSVDVLGAGVETVETAVLAVAALLSAAGTG
jgi:adenosylcobinamide-GDP ribazoletransferase